jgi:hypothetical protein
MTLVVTGSLYLVNRLASSLSLLRKLSAIVNFN